MSAEDHAKNLGAVILNLHSLEFYLRAFLHHLPGSRPLGVKWGTSVFALPVGTQLPESEITSYDSLGDLLKRFNREVGSRGIGGPIDVTLVDLRDALAHGRVARDRRDNTRRLIKFSRPKNGFVTVTYNEVLTPAWLKKQGRRVVDAIETVHLAYKTLPEPTPVQPFP